MISMALSMYLWYSYMVVLVCAAGVLRMNTFSLFVVFMGLGSGDLLYDEGSNVEEVYDLGVSFRREKDFGAGYSLKDKNEAKPDKTESGIEKSAKNQGQRA
ncbi:hypothetical protein Tco_0013449 [Tanacetum coccineum]